MPPAGAVRRRGARRAPGRFGTWWLVLLLAFSVGAAIGRGLSGLTPHQSPAVLRADTVPATAGPWLSVEARLEPPPAGAGGPDEDWLRAALSRSPVDLDALAETAGGRDGIVVHVVQPGETLWDIALHHDLDVETLVAANGITRPDRIAVGQSLKILPVRGVLYRVRAGDTVDQLARRFGVEVAAIERVNRLADPDRLRVGQELVIPGVRPARATAVAAGVSAGGDLVWPVQGRLTSGFGLRWGRMHSGIDLAAPHGRPVVAAAAGQVRYAGWRGGYGITVIIDHGGWSTWYAHLSQAAVKRGEWAAAGQVIGRVGSTGYSTGPHLHFEVHRNGRPIDPLTVLR